MSESLKPENPMESQPAQEVAEEERLVVEVGRSLQRENRRILLLGLGVIAFMAIAHFTPLRAWLTNVQAWKAYVRDQGWVAHVGFAAMTMFSVMVGVPRLALCGVAGLVFGFMEGLALSLLGSTLGSYAAFMISRLGGRHAVLQRVRQWPWLEQMLQKPSWVRVFWVRQLMLPGLVLNVLLGVTHVRHSTFLVGTLLGYLPLNITLSLLGSGLGKGMLQQTITQSLFALGLLHLVGWAVWKRLRSR